MGGLELNANRRVTTGGAAWLVMGGKGIMSVSGWSGAIWQRAHARRRESPPQGGGVLLADHLGSTKWAGMLARQSGLRDAFNHSNSLDIGGPKSGAQPVWRCPSADRPILEAEQPLLSAAVQENEP